ncbi:50S ribosomal protein L22 [Candidatus Uhrbacteria bacterium]|jgi:large subunit ribosomal protein L22|nr:50S ribosomal protein L22 [Candidatus Uhrbacteria bacterium]MBT7717101.1 50S ribosomal protein L22 [Candidatus Uhrbacteria bacterium]
MQVQATAKYIHMSPRKVRLVADLVRGLGIDQAQKQLQFSQKLAAQPVLKVLNSAIANAKNNNSINVESYKVASITVDEGPTIKRFRPRAHGKSAPIRKRTSHITVKIGPTQIKTKVQEK